MSQNITKTSQTFCMGNQIGRRHHGSQERDCNLED